MNNQYQIQKDIKYINIAYLDVAKLNGFKFKPSNKVYYDGVTVTKMTIINYSFVEKILKKKIKKRLEVYLRFIISIVDGDGDTDATDCRAALNDLTRFKDIIKYKYQKYLDQKYLLLLLKKIELLEKELKTKIYYYKEPEEKETHRRR